MREYTEMVVQDLLQVCGEFFNGSMISSQSKQGKAIFTTKPAPNIKRTSKMNPKLHLQLDKKKMPRLLSRSELFQRYRAMNHNKGLDQGVSSEDNIYKF